MVPCIKYKLIDGKLVCLGESRRRSPTARPPLEVLYNESYDDEGRGIPGDVREKHYAEHVKAIRKTGGLTKGRRMRHIGSIPSEHFWKVQAESSQGRPDDGRLNDHSELKRFIKENDYNVAPKSAF